MRDNHWGNKFGLCGCEMSVKVCVLYIHKVYTKDEGQSMRKSIWVWEMSVKVCLLYDMYIKFIPRMRDNLWENINLAYMCVKCV